MPSSRSTSTNEELITSLDDQEEEIEGLEETPPDEPFRDYPIDSLHIRHESRTVFEVLRRINAGTYIMDPEFQRDFIWDLERQSRLIESVLMRIPLPVFYLAENDEGKLVVVDGLQRLTTFKRYLNGEFSLSLRNAELNGMGFTDLPVKLQNRIEDTQLILYIIDHKVPVQAKLDIFDRVNSGVALTRQQMRNCLYLGPATRWVRAQADTDLFRQATGHSLRTHGMRDREVVNRFCSFMLLGYQALQRTIDEFLAEGLRRMNQLGEKDEAALESLRERFHRSLTNNLEVFGKHAFRKHDPSQTNQKRKPFNVALFDVFSVLLADYPLDVIQNNVDKIRLGFSGLMQDEDFVTAISNATSSAERVRTRFEKAQTMLTGVLNADNH